MLVCSLEQIVCNLWYSLIMNGVIAKVVRREMSVVADTVLKGMCSVAGVVSSVI